MRDVLYSLDRCDACLNKKQHHLNKCYNITRERDQIVITVTKQTMSPSHVMVKKHPGSWIVNER